MKRVIVQNSLLKPPFFLNQNIIFENKTLFLKTNIISNGKNKIY